MSAGMDAEMAEDTRQTPLTAALADLDRALSALEACIYRDPDHNAAWMEGGSVPVYATEEARDAYDRLVVALYEDRAAWAYAEADAMLAERKRGNDG